MGKGRHSGVPDGSRTFSQWEPDILPRRRNHLPPLSLKSPGRRGLRLAFLGLRPLFYLFLLREEGNI